MLAWYFTEKDSDWGIVVHGETRAKAKTRAKSVWPGDEFIWTLLRAKRVPDLDNISLIAEDAAKFFTDGDEELKPEDYHNFCNCPLCKDIGQIKNAKYISKVICR